MTEQSRETALKTVTEGTRVCCVVRDGSRQAKTPVGTVPIWTGGIYEARCRKSDGILTWRRVDSFGGTVSGHKPSNKFLQQLQSEAPYEWLDVRHGQFVMPRMSE